MNFHVLWLHSSIMRQETTEPAGVDTWKAVEVARRYTRRHFDLRLHACTAELDGVPVIAQGRSA
jgi:hypothetical protein